MGDAGGNLEEQLESLEEQIGSLEEQIGREEERILKVEERISRVEEEIINCTDDDERKRLRDEAAQLRDEESRLRYEKSRLRHEEIRLLQLWRGRDLGTEYEWLVQKVVELDLPSEACIYPISSKREHMWTPVRVEHWDVRDNIEESLSIADKKKRVYNLDITRNTEEMKNMGNGERMSVFYILKIMHSFMKKKEPLSILGLNSESRLCVSKRRENDEIGLDEVATASGLVEVYTRGPVADFLVTLGEKNVFAVQVKYGNLGPERGNSWDLHKVWAECTSKQGEGDSFQVMRFINQLYEDMVLFKVGYGVLTNARCWYLFKRDNAGCLKISTAFKGSNEPPRVLAALSYLVNTASRDNSECSNPTGNGQFPAIPKAAPSKSSDESTDGKVNNPNYRVLGSNSSGSQIRRSGGTCADWNQMILQDISAEDLNLNCSGIISCEGASGYVVIGHLHGQPVALKFAYVGTIRAEDLLQEVVAYMKMEKLWGVVVPQLVGHGTTNRGRVVFVATELIEGVELGEVTVTREMETAALEALDAVHACGLLHGDISPKNIMVVRGKQPSVRILDFGLACVNSRKKSQKVERMHLESLLRHEVKLTGE